MSEAGKDLKEIEDEIKAPIIRTVKSDINLTEERVSAAMKGIASKSVQCSFEIPNIIMQN
ncbi:hypothetical protein AGMMS49573_03500 [Endomicrobiia bacterium]|nr:hypothetical protein AGMMS49573_03500 [Endomicrobiia bacterium]